MKSHRHRLAKGLARTLRHQHGPSAVIQGMLGNALQRHQAGRLSEAERIYRQILAIDSHHADSLHLLGMVAYETGSYEIAVEMIRKAVGINQQEATYHANLGTVFRAQGRLEEAAASYERALGLRPSLAEVHTNLGIVLQAQDRLEEAMACHERALALKPELADAHYNLAVAQLLKGEFAAGWRNFEWRWQTRDHLPMRVYRQPLWTGERLASGRVLIWREQGVGDEAMFAGLIPDVIRTGNRSLLDCDARLKPLFARSFPGIDVVSGSGVLLYPDKEIAAHVPSGSLPGLFRKSAEDFAGTASPYLIADAGARERLRAAYADGRRLVGLAWHTNNRKTGRARSIDLELLAPLLERSDIRWISLQYGDHDELEREAGAAGVNLFLDIDRTVNQLLDIDLFAAQIAAMDLVVTIDNSTAHLAGALGVPTWVLLPFAPDWRWLRGREDSPWYPTLRLFRQAKRGDWESVVEAVGRAL